MSIEKPQEGTSPGVVWTIAGFDPSSGAGITADLMTFAAHGLFGCSAITALTVQSTLGVAATEPVRSDLLTQTLEHLWADLPARGVKIGMIGNGANAAVIGRFLAGVRAPGAEAQPVVVFDPVLRSSSGRELYPAAEVSMLHRELLPWVDWITPNWQELALLAERPVASLLQAEAAAHGLIARHPGLNVVATGGDQIEPIDLVVTRCGDMRALRGEPVETAATHGTGCAFSAALLAKLVRGTPEIEAAEAAKRFVVEAMRRAPGLGGGKGPLGLLWRLGEP